MRKFLIVFLSFSLLSIQAQECLAATIICTDGTIQFSTYDMRHYKWLKHYYLDTRDDSVCENFDEQQINLALFGRIISSYDTPAPKFDWNTMRTLQRCARSPDMIKKLKPNYVTNTFLAAFYLEGKPRLLKRFAKQYNKLDGPKHPLIKQWTDNSFSVSAFLGPKKGMSIGSFACEDLRTLHGISHLGLISALDVSNNYIKKIDTSFALTNINDIDLSSNKLETLNLDDFATCKFLQTLLVQDNNIGSLSKSKQQLCHLKILNISGNKIKKLDLKHLLKCTPNLEGCYAHDNDISDIRWPRPTACKQFVHVYATNVIHSTRADGADGLTLTLWKNPVADKILARGYWYWFKDADSSIKKTILSCLISIGLCIFDLEYANHSSTSEVISNNSMFIACYFILQAINEINKAKIIDKIILPPGNRDC